MAKEAAKLGVVMEPIGDSGTDKMAFQTSNEECGNSDGENIPLDMEVAVVATDCAMVVTEPMGERGGDMQSPTSNEVPSTTSHDLNGCSEENNKMLLWVLVLLKHHFWRRMLRSCHLRVLGLLLKKLLRRWIH